MRFALVFSLLIALVAVIFAFENPDPVNVEFLTLRSQPVPLALVIIVSLLAGVLVGALFSVPSRIRSRNRIKRLEKQITDSGATPHETVVVEKKTVPASRTEPAGGAVETDRLATETRQMAEDAQRRAAEAERRSRNE